MRYRALAGDWWDATVLQRRIDGTVDIEIPRTKVMLTRIAVHRGAPAGCPKGVAMENPTDGEEAHAR